MSATPEILETSPASQGAQKALRIAVVTPELHRHGGTERGTAEVVTRLAQGNTICLFAYHWEPDGTPNICFHRVPVIRWPGLLQYLSFYFLASRAVDRASRQHGGFDAVYSPGPNCRQVGVCSAWFCQARQNELLASGRLRPAPAGVADALRLLHRRVYAWIGTRIEKKFYSSPHLERVLTCAATLKDDLVRCYGVPEQKIVVTHSGVDTVNFSPEHRAHLREKARKKLGLGNEFCFAFIGTDWVRKGMLTVLNALKAVPESRLLAVSPYDPAAYVRHAKRIGVADRLLFAPPRPDIVFYLAAADALVAPSVYEPFGLIPLEAMACGLPVIIAEGMGVTEIVGPEDCLVVSQVEDPRELALQMQRMAGDAALRARLVENGLRLARRHPWDGIYRAIAAELLRTAQAAGAKQS